MAGETIVSVPDWPFSATTFQHPEDSPLNILLNADPNSLVAFIWYDAWNNVSWLSREEIEREVLDDGGKQVLTIGWLIQVTDEWVTVSHSKASDDEILGHLTVPLVWVQSVKVLDWPL